jgi:hypothetical protein
MMIGTRTDRPEDDPSRRSALEELLQRHILYETGQHSWTLTGKDCSVCQWLRGEAQPHKG